MPSVLFLSLMNSAAWGGSEEIWHQSAIYLSKKDFKVGVCCFNWPGKEEKLEELKNSGVDLFLLPGRNDTRSLIGKLKLKKRLYTVPFKNYERIIVNQGGWKDVAHGPFKKLNHGLPPYVLLFHNYDESDLLPADKKRLFLHWVNGAQKNVGDAGRIFSGIQKSIDVNVPYQAILFNPITFAQPVEITPFADSPENKLTFTMLAELDVKRKAQDELIKTLATEKWRARNFELNLYGKGQDQSYLEQLIAEKGLSTKVFLKGFTKNVKDVIAQSHVILQLTHFDAMPIAVTEALAVSRPVIVTNVGDMPQWVKDDVNGWVAPNASIQEIDLVLEKAWQHRRRLEEMGKESFRIFKEKYPEEPIKFFLELSGIELS